MNTSEGIVRKPELLNFLKLSDATVWRLERAGRFPKRINLGANSVGWLRSEVQQWVQERADER